MIHHAVAGYVSSLFAVTSSFIYIRSPVTGKITRIDVYCAASQITPPDIIFDVNVGPSPGAILSLFSDPANRPKITTGSLKGNVSGLSAAVAKDDIITVDLDQPSAGVPGPIFVILTIDDGDSDVARRFLSMGG